VGTSNHERLGTDPFSEQPVNPDPRIIAIARAVRTIGGRVLIVGGWVRDRVLGIPSKDIDIEVHGVTMDELEHVLSGFGEVIPMGRQFGVLQVKGLHADFALPRLDRRVGAGHRGFEIQTDPSSGYPRSARRRDLTINSMGFDPLTEELLDPYDGRRDLASGILRATDAATFGEDPLRALRVAQFAARFSMTPEASLVSLCSALDLSELAAERIFEEFHKLLVRGVEPSRGFAFLRACGLIRFFPEIAALIGVPQDPTWHPEGDVWTHTLMVVDEAARLRQDEPADVPLMFAALCHDLGKPATTECRDGRIRSPSHAPRGVPPTRALLRRWRAPKRLIAQVSAMVEHHLAPATFPEQGAKPRAYRRLARRLATAGVSMQQLERLSRADHLGRTTPEALSRQFAAGDRFLEEVRKLDLETAPPQDAVQGHHLVARGFQSGPELGRLLTRCRALQDETGWTDPQRILDKVLHDLDSGHGGPRWRDER